MAELRIRTARHTVRVAAPPKRVYRLIADVARWAEIFDPIVSVAPLGGGRVRIWELVDDEVRGCVSHREPNPRRLQLRFRQQGAPHPVAAMGGLWLVLARGTGSLVVLDHYYRVVDDDPADVEWLAEAVDRTGTAMLAALRQTAELDGELDRCWLSARHSVDIDGDATDVFDFLARVRDWPQRLPHVDRLTLAEDVCDIQHVHSDVRLPDGSVHTTRMVRLCLPPDNIVFKYTEPPAIMRAHTGSYSITRLPRGVRATAAHTVLLRQSAGEVLARGSTVEHARAQVRQVLRDLSQATLGRAKSFAESRRPMRVGATHQ